MTTLSIAAFLLIVAILIGYFARRDDRDFFQKIADTVAAVSGIYIALYASMHAEPERHEVEERVKLSIDLVILQQNSRFIHKSVKSRLASVQLWVNNCKARTDTHDDCPSSSLAEENVVGVLQAPGRIHNYLKRVLENESIYTAVSWSFLNHLEEAQWALNNRFVQPFETREKIDWKNTESALKVVGELTNNNGIAANFVSFSAELAEVACLLTNGLNSSMSPAAFEGLYKETFFQLDTSQKFSVLYKDNIRDSSWLKSKKCGDL